jgi:hypothetical protein
MEPRFRRRRSPLGPDRCLLSVARDDFPEDVFAGRIHQVEQDDDERDER